VSVEFSGFSGADINMRRGTYPLQKKPPLTPGYCFVGQVHENGPGSTKFQRGDRVACLSIYGAEAELINVPEKYLVPIPPGVDSKLSAMQRAGGVDAVFDALGFESWDESYSILRRGGVLVAYGLNLPALSGSAPRPVLPAVIKLLARNLAFWTGKKTVFYYISRDSKRFVPDLETLFQLLQRGKLTVPIKLTVPLAEIQRAHREWAKGFGMGSILVDVQK
jgi:NADPH:quinone reductase-like Zn-dependent oxidoreductase